MAAGSVKQNQKTGTWYGRCDAPRDSRGHRIQLRVFAATERECWRKLRAKLADIEAGKPVSRDTEKMTVSDLLDLWLTTKQGKQFRTRDSYESTTRLHLRPTLGHLRVRDVRRSDIERAIVTWQTGPRLDGKPGSRGNTTVRQCITYISGAFKLAKDDGLRPDNPVEGVKRPPRTKSRKVFVLAEGARRILEVARVTSYYTPLLTAFGLGIRPGELMALRLMDVDCSAGDVHVATALEYRGKHLERKPTKTDAGNRIIPISPLMIALLTEHIAAQKSRLLDLGVMIKPDTPLFDDVDGRIWHPEKFSKGLRTLLRAAKLDAFPWSATRHSFASMGVDEDVHTKVLATILGHDDDKITSAIYEQVSRASKLEANRLIVETLISGSVA